MHRPKLTAPCPTLLTLASWAIAVLFATPAFSQTTPPSIEQLPATTQTLESIQLAQTQDAHAQAARELIAKLGPLQSNDEAFYTAFSTSAVEGFQAQISRPLTELERQQLYSFWYERAQTSLTSEELQESLVEVYVEAFTLEELTAINQFYETPAGKKWEAVLPSLQQTLGQISSEYLLALSADEAWLNNTINDLLVEIPSLAEPQAE